jgi:hypothetical protein
MIALMRPRTPGNDVKIVFGDANTKVSRETIHHPTIGKYSDRSNLLWADKWRSCTRELTFKDGRYLDGRYFSDVIDMRAQIFICRAYMTRYKKAVRTCLSRDRNFWLILARLALFFLWYGSFHSRL